ncbi:MAG TPA: DUF1996 domain-containing protein [Hydrogenophaga sp.]|nr:DUF1996 domain-containing protein [Hydrogenophaga sp.]
MPSVPIEPTAEHNHTPWHSAARRLRSLFAGAACVAVLLGCGGEGGNESGTAPAEAQPLALSATGASTSDHSEHGPYVNESGPASAAAPSQALSATGLQTTDHSGHGPYINNALIPPPVATSFDTVMISATDEQPVDSDSGAFRTTCGYAHMLYDDPIVFPNQPRQSHLHTFFGNTGVTAASTAESIRTEGNSTCRGGLANRSAYWVPSMIDTLDGRPLVPKSSQFYYKLGDKRLDATQVQPLPEGLRMIAGDAKNAAPSGPFWFNCKGGSNFKNIQNCPVGTDLYQNISFPQCWDGRNLDSADHKSHMAYAETNKQNKTVACPATHPVLLPEITFRIVYAVSEANAPTRWRLSSDMYDPALPAGYSSHGDWFNGWQKSVNESWTAACVRARKDCHSHLIGVWPLGLTGKNSRINGSPPQ